MRVLKDRLTYSGHSTSHQDLYGVFMKKLSYFIVELDPESSDTVKLLALLQEMIKVKKLIARSHKGDAIAVA
jgi:hypothetical protein